MPEAGIHFAEPTWLWALLAILPMAWWLKRSPSHGYEGRIRRYADTHLLPYLTGTRELKAVERWRRFGLWSLLWALLVIAMAGPRWDFADVRLFRPGASLVVLLDISKSMDVADVPPSRLARARQEVEDLISQNRELRIGLIAFASVAHVIAPVTEDAHSIRVQLPALSTDLVGLQGSRLSLALDRARELLAGQPDEEALSILLISDGDFENRKALETQVSNLAKDGITLYVLGIGTTAGGPVPASRGRWITGRDGSPVESKLDIVGLSELAEAGHGIYQTADYRDEDTAEILELAARGQKAQAAAGDARTRVWNERFYWLVLLAVALVLPHFRSRPRIVSSEVKK
jgi:Ca-activated chloride channel family protein